MQMGETSFKPCMLQYSVDLSTNLSEKGLLHNITSRKDTYNNIEYGFLRYIY